MINKSKEYTRRILNFPAIRPCESVCFSTLVNSLIDLCHTICEYKSRTFFTNKKNARDSIRLIENFLVFLDEMPNENSRIESTLVLGLSELHFIFQKIQFLLEDCSRDDARIWMLVMSENVATQFRVLTRSIAVALEVLVPLDGLDVCVEVRELVEFVTRQALRGEFGEFDVDVYDRRVSRKVVRVLDRFGNGIVPESSDLTRILEYLGIRSWAECNREVKFLESECLAAENRDVSFLSSLMAFMIYCRCTLFGVVDNAPIRQSDGGGCISDLISCLNPDDFRCPITLEIMMDPVIVSTGHTYDRSSITKWFKSGNHTCPKTGERLTSVDLVPNLALKRLIKQYCSENRIPFVEISNDDVTRRSPGAGSATAEKVMTLLASFLVGELVTGTSEARRKAAYEIRLLTKTSVFNRSCLVGADAIPSLLNLLGSSNPAAAQENAIAALMNISKYSKSKRIVIESGGLELIVGLLNKGTRIESRQHAAGTLFYLASVEEYRKMIGEIPNAIPALMELVRDGPDRAKKNALVAIFGLLTSRENHRRVLAAGFVPLLVNLLTTSDLVTDSLAILATLAEKLDGTVAIIRAGTLPLIAEVLISLNCRGAKEYCVSLLLALCINDGADVVPVLAKNPSLMVALYSLLTDGTPRATRKARSLIRILHAFNEKISFTAPALPPEQFIHVW